MALQWSGVIASTVEYNGSGSNYINGQIYSNDATRSNNTVTITGIYVGHSLNSGFDDWEWTSDIYANGSLRLNDSQTKGRTGGTYISGNWYYSPTASHSFAVGTGAGAFDISANWQSLHYGDSSGQQGVSIGFPAAGAPTVTSKSSSSIGTTTTTINWTTSVGAYCTFSTVHIQYGTTLSYGSSITGRPQNGSYGLTGLTPGTLYYYRIYAANGAGLTVYSSSGTFTTLGYAVIDTFTRTPITDQSFTLTLDPDTTCDRYEYKLDGGSWTTYYTGSSSTAQSITFNNLPSDTAYTIQGRVRKLTGSLYTETAVENVTTLAQNNFLGFL